MATIPESHKDLLDASVAMLSTIDPQGRPQSTVIWFLAEGDTVRTSLNTKRQKTKNLQRDPGCSLLILDLANPYRYLELRGTAVLEPDDDYAFADRLGKKYGTDLRHIDGDGGSRVVATFVPERIHAIDMTG